MRIKLSQIKLTKKRRLLQLHKTQVAQATLGQHIARSLTAIRHARQDLARACADLEYAWTVSKLQAKVITKLKDVF